MDKIYECAAKFVAIEDYEYRFVVSKNRKTIELLLDFRDSDFFHLAGFQYLTDISIPQNRRDILKNIIEKKIITDELLNKSRFYNENRSDKNIKSRIDELRFLEQYLDTNNIIRIYNTHNMKYLHSMINADYLIESQFKGSVDTVYIFLKHREQDSRYLCPISFFKKDKIAYGGDLLYWMLKEKRSNRDCVVLYKHDKYGL